MSKEKTPGEMGVYVGDIVYWYHDGTTDNPPIPAVIQKIGNGTNLSLSVMGENRRMLDIRDGVKYVGDKTARSIELNESGLWDYHPRFPAIVPETNTKEQKKAS